MKIKVNGKILTFCGKCHEEISFGKEITIKSKVLICKKCFQESSAMCHECCLPIFKNELIHEVSESWDVEDESRSVNLTQCCLCYRDWLKETKELKRIGRWKKLIIKIHHQNFRLLMEPETKSNKHKKASVPKNIIEKWKINSQFTFFFIN